ncbi:MAG: hypothetical protein O3B86_14155 [Planctomycetota bacterium]|nr:hypothetical protein [Planctomycetota bacterium]
MKMSSSFAVLVALSATPLVARELPFEAVVRGDSAEVRSGAGLDDYYPTQKLKRGTKVRVIREDYGGWYMIEPPEGSHSWIRAEFVTRRGKDKGIVSENTVDRIGSELDRSNLSVIHQVTQGEVVTILGTATMRAGDKPVEMLKIAPPRGEYRYVNRREVTPVDDSAGGPNLLGSAQADRPAATGPFGDSVPADLNGTDNGLREARVEVVSGVDAASADMNKGLTGSPATENSDINRLPDSAGQGITTPGSTFEAPQPLGLTMQSPEDQARVELAWNNVMQTDGQFRQMLKRPVSEWNLASLRQVYEQSASQIENPSLKRQIENRIAAVDRYQKLFADQIAIEQILQTTEARDAEIRQSYIAKWHSVSTTNHPTTRIVKPQPSRPAPSGQQAAAPAGLAAQFAGAGFVQRSALARPGIPSYVLLAPDGRVLSYLQAGPGINLDAYVGKSVGIQGARSFRRELNADLMIVRGLTPVNLQP